MRVKTSFIAVEVIVVVVVVKTKVTGSEVKTWEQLLCNPSLKKIKKKNVRYEYVYAIDIWKYSLIIIKKAENGNNRK